MGVEPAGHYLEVSPGVEIYYEDHGPRSSPVIVLIPGWTFTTEVFVHQIAHFAPSHRVVVVDPRSQGRSCKTPHGNDFETRGADLTAVFSALGLRDAVLVGWSTGSLDALGFVRKAGTGLIRAFVGIDMSPKPMSTKEADDWVEGTLAELSEAYRALRTPAGHREFVAAYAKDVMVQRPLTPAELDWILRQSLTTPTHFATAIYASALFSDFSAELRAASAAVPTLYVVSEHWADQATGYLRHEFPKVRTEVLGGHMMFWEYPGKFNAALEKFIAGVDEARKPQRRGLGLLWR
ncbi:halide peroxidase [Hyaloraphidium curvatum]|nr:halide peroxidase [Hyaloraphidium curvatum]